MNTQYRRVMIAVSVFALPLAALAGQVPDRPTLQAILGGGGTLEDFETLNLSPGSQVSDTGGLLNSTTMFAGNGPGLVQPGVDYIAPELFWNAEGYYGLPTQALGDCTGWRGLQMTLSYTTPVLAMGFDMYDYDLFPSDGVVTVYDAGGGLLGSANVSAIIGPFFGWEDAGGIGSVVISANSQAYINIDDHLYGPIPAPGCAAVLGLAGLLGGRQRR